MTNLHTDEIVFFLHLTKIGTNENKAIYSNIHFMTSPAWMLVFCLFMNVIYKFLNVCPFDCTTFVGNGKKVGPF